ncbi:MAG: sigma-54-dependent transcriptional regulator [Planctomycetota bacterium]
MTYPSSALRTIVAERGLHHAPNRPCQLFRHACRFIRHRPVASHALSDSVPTHVRHAPPDAIVLDVRLPGIDGLEAMQRFRQVLGSVPIVVITAYGDLSTAVAAVRNGAFDYVTKPFDLRTAEHTIRRALAAGEVEAEGPPVSQSDAHARILGSSDAMQEVFKRIALVAAAETCVHIRGESGTGKEMAARAIHRHSRRAEGLFVAINLASLSSSLVESELFGHARGAFTGAEHARRGLLAQADGGVVFLDEVADIPMPLQIKLLRTLEQGEVLPVGSNQPVHSDFRVISATHQNLPELVSRSRFRHDLYFRLGAFEIEMPPLRDRQDDVRVLAEHFLAQVAADSGHAPPTLSAAAIEQLQRMPWYGNVRELRNSVEHAVVLARSGAIMAEHLPPPAPASMTAASIQSDALPRLIRQWTETQLETRNVDDLYERLLRIVEPPLLKAAMARFRGQCATAARHLGLHRTTLRKKLEQHGIDKTGR